MSMQDFGPRTIKAGGFVFTATPKLGLEVINKTASTIATDKIVHINGFDVASGRPTIALADADVAGHVDLYVTTQAILDGNQSIVYKGYPSAANLNTSGVTTVGDPVYLDTTAGAFTATPPTASNSRKVRVGFVTVKSASVGKIFWMISPITKYGSDEFQTGAVTASSAFTAAVLAAAGNAQGNAAVIATDEIAVTGADGTKGVLLPLAASGSLRIIVNTDSTNLLKVYPGTGAAINAIAANSAFVLGPDQAAVFIGTSATQWYTPGQAADTATVAAMNTISGITAGAQLASKAKIVDVNKAVDLDYTTTTRTLGGTGVPAAANVVTEGVKEVTAIADATATTILTITVPNAAHAGMIDFAIVSRLGAGGAIGADEAVSSSRYQLTFNRTTGVASVATLSAQLGAVNTAVAGAATVTATLSIVNSAEGVGVSNTHLVKVTITKSGGSSANHKCDVHWRIHNANITGVSIA